MKLIEVRTIFMLAVVAASASLSSCEKEEMPYLLPPSGDVQLMAASMGVNYDNQVYVDLETGNKISVPYRSYDLAFEAAPGGFRVYLNTGKFMFVAHTGVNNMASADTTGKSWETETEHLYDDSTAIGNWTGGLSGGSSEVFVIDRGRTEYFGSERWYKLQLISVDANKYHIHFSRYNSSQVIDFDIPKNPDFSLMYFSFTNGGSMVNVAPKKDDWDIVFTKYTYTYYSEPVTSPYRHYLVTGALLNKWAGCENEQMRKDSSVGYVPFEAFAPSNISSVNFNQLAGTIGFSWKDYDFTLGYIIVPDRYYLLRDNRGFVYKIRFIDFYDDQGNKGTAKFEYQRL